MFDNEEGKVWALCLDQNASFWAETGFQSSQGMGHFDKFYEKRRLKTVWISSEKHAQSGSKNSLYWKWTENYIN